MTYMDVGPGISGLGVVQKSKWNAVYSDISEELPLSAVQRCGVGLLCTVLCLYFMPMLSVIPLALAGGLHMPNPHAADYNRLNNRTGLSIPRPGVMPTGPWYWDLQYDCFLVVAVPMTVLTTAYFLKMRTATARASPKPFHSL